MEDNKRTLIFETPGSFPIDSFLIFGLSEKPNTKNPIGYYGTGLKYALAILLRHAANVKLITNGITYNFYIDEIIFRNKSVNAIFVKNDSNSEIIQLPFTIELGKNWKLWQAFRELVSNTSDENGIIYSYESSFKPVKNNSYFIVESNEFYKFYESSNDVFLKPTELKLIYSDDKLEVFDKPSDAIYYKNIRAYELNRNAAYTYNIIDNVELTEDRSIKYEFIINDMIVNSVLTSNNTDYIKRVLNGAAFEKSLPFEYTSAKFSDEFKSIALSNENSNENVKRFVTNRFRVKKAKEEPEKFYNLPWKKMVYSDSIAIQNCNGDDILKFENNKENKEFVSLITTAVNLFVKNNSHKSNKSLLS